MKLKSKRILVTGGAGFIGSHLVEKLIEKGAAVKVLVRYNSQNNWGMLEKIPEKILDSIEICYGDLRDPDSIRDALKKQEVVFHLGALIAIPYSFKNPVDFVQTNVLGTANLLKACVDQSIFRFIHTSTCEVYGTAQYVPIDETHPMVAHSPYSATKIAAEKLVESFILSYKLPAVILRPFNTFGPRQSARAIIPAIIIQALSREVICLGNLKPTRDMNFVNDTVKGIILSAETDAAVGEVINLGNNKEISIGELVQRILKILKKENMKIIQSEERLRSPGREVYRLMADNRKAQNLLGWLPETGLEKGLKKTISWIQQNISSYKKQIFNI